MLFIRVISLDTCVFKHVIFALFPAQTAKPRYAPQLQYTKLMYHCKGCIFNMHYHKFATLQIWKDFFFKGFIFKSCQKFYFHTPFSQNTITQIFIEVNWFSDNSDLFTMFFFFTPTSWSLQWSCSLLRKSSL